MSLGTPLYSNTPDRPDGWTAPVDDPQRYKGTRYAQRRNYGELWEAFKQMQRESAETLAPVYAAKGQHCSVDQGWREREVIKEQQNEMK